MLLRPECRAKLIGADIVPHTMGARRSKSIGAVAAVVGIMAVVGLPSSDANKDRLRFGVYPWGAAGATTEIAPPVPEDPEESLAAVRRLRGSNRDFVVHLYADYSGTSDESADGLLREARWWASNGLQVAAVLRYRPADASRAPGYAAWVRTQARRLAALDRVVSIQVGNEPNNPARGAGDGSYPGVIEAIAAAVPVARREAVAAGRPDLLIGFNWAAGPEPTRTEPMWGELRRAGGDAFARSVGFVGVDLYPGTWSPLPEDREPHEDQVDAAVRATLRALRTRHMPAAGIGRDASIVIAEAGYPTTPARSEATQDTVLRGIVRAAQGTSGVTDVYWFALRDGNSASGQLENGYGLLRDDYGEKPAFETFRRLMAS